MTWQLRCIPLLIGIVKHHHSMFEDVAPKYPNRF